MRKILLACLLLAAWSPLGAQEKTAWPKPDPGPTQVATLTLDWTDAARNRSVPVKIYYPKQTDKPVPVIVYSHGTGGSREGYAYLGKFWASHGYVVVHPQHAGSDIKAALGSGKLLDGIKKAAADPRNAIERPKDITFVLDRLSQMSKEKNKGELTGKMNLNAIGLSGHSFGAHTTLVTVGQWMGGLAVQDKRIKAIIPMSAPAPKASLQKVFAAVSVPNMHMTGTLDDSPIGDTKAKDRRIAYDNIHNTDKFLINFEGGDHMIFSGRFSLKDRKKDGEFHRCIKQASLAFWDCYLKSDGQAAVWLMGKGMPEYIGKLATVEVKLKR